ncbi:MAG: hypothetical protein J5570_09050 [Lachnospiraceae bacterium]|nr:hypothetical protein [Lachnospiraceae bacterium]
MIASFILDYSVMFIKMDYFSVAYFILGISFVVNEKRALKKAEEEN